MKIRDRIAFLVSLMIGLSACQSQTEPCTVKGTIQGVNEGARLTLKDAWNKYKDISTATVENGSFEFHSRISAPTYVYMYAENPKDVYGNLYDGGQLKDFILEPGTIIADVNAYDESDMFTGAKGTALNDAYWKIQAAEGDEREALWEEAMRDGQTNLLTLVYADSHSPSPARTLEIVDNLPPELVKANKSFISRLKKRCIRRIKADERRDDSGQNTEEGIIVPEYYIDMKFPDPDGKQVSLRSVVDDPANRYVILDFWATWCLPCVKSIPMLKEVYERYHDKGLEIYSVSQDSKAREWKSFVAENGMTWVNVLSEGGRVYKDYAVKLIPTVFLIDCKTGKILVRDGHPDLEAILSELLGSE